ncbi:hypothetical protein BCON_0154g00310 [Botryotinia convoluta]|uniref:Uncharacterized protein n=1 Tax=Botryotinia convoluta TaxID=54673 RepID=A0A4Z1HSE9_9HELO|nr:hypothetical protein BCON_0154g00310 [Botryotinia convoluta]
MKILASRICEPCNVTTTVLVGAVNVNGARLEVGSVEDTELDVGTALEDEFPAAAEESVVQAPSGQYP